MTDNRTMISDAPTRRSERLVIRVTALDKTLVERAAELERCTVASFVMSHAKAAAKKVVHEHSAIRLNQTESRRFVAALLAPTKAPTRRMREAISLYRRTVVEH